MKNYQNTLILLECINIYMQLGHSFLTSLELALKNIPPRSELHIFFKKNVVLQQPKSRNCTIFYELSKNLNTLSQQNLGKKEFLQFIKCKFQLNFDLEQKISLASTQYKAQSTALIFFWLLSILVRIGNNDLFIYKEAITVSFILMTAGLLIAKKLLMKTQFRI